MRPAQVMTVVPTVLLNSLPVLADTLISDGAGGQFGKPCQRPEIDLGKVPPGTHCILEENACLDQVGLCSFID